MRMWQMKAFSVVRKNKGACITHLVKLAQRIERCWEKEDTRLSLLGVFRDALVSLEGHKHPDCQELSRQGQKIKKLDFSIKHFHAMVLPIERKHTRGLRDHEFLVTTDDRPAAAPTKIPLVLVLDNLRSAFNTGSIFRTAECLGVSKIYLCGYTATPDDAQTKKTTMGTHEYVAWEWRQSTAACLEELAAAGTPIVALETVAEQPFVNEYSFPRSGCALVLGNERHGIEAELLAKCTATVKIACVGVKNSLNVGVAFGMCGYEIARQWSTPP